MMRIIFGPLVALSMLLGNVFAAQQEETLQYKGFGTLHIYGAPRHPANVVLFISGDGGWNRGVVEMALELASLNSLVVGIDITHYYKTLAADAGQCSNVSGDFEGLSRYVEQRFHLPNYAHPVLVGYSSGATLAYAILVQAPPGTFRGAISLGFCPDLPLRKRLCRGNGLASTPGAHGKGYVFLSAQHLASPWVVLQGNSDKVCSATETAVFVKQTGHARLVSLPGVGHGFSVQRKWVPQFKEAFGSLVQSRDDIH